MKLLRREFLHLLAGAAAASTVTSPLVWAQAAPQRVRVATGLLAAWQSTAWLGAESGLFKQRGIDVTFPALAVGVQWLLLGSLAATGSLPTPEACLSQKKYSKAAIL